MEEEWRDVKGFEGLYEISNLGRLKSLAYIDKRKRRHKERIITLHNKRGWYLTTPLRRGDSPKTMRIHRMVYEAFVGPIPKDCDIHHKDENKQNNRLDNLEMINRTEHHSLHGHDPRIYKAMNDYNHKRSRPVTAIQFNGMPYLSFPNAQVASEITGVCARNINQVADRTEFKPGHVRVQAGGYVWVYRDEVDHRNIREFGERIRARLGKRATPLRVWHYCEETDSVVIELVR